MKRPSSGTKFEFKVLADTLKIKLHEEMIKARDCFAFCLRQNGLAMTLKNTFPSLRGA